MKNSFKNLSYQELKTKRDELKKKFMEFRFKNVVGHVDNPVQKRTMRRQIARLNTLIHAQDSLLKSDASKTAAGGSNRDKTPADKGAK